MTDDPRDAELEAVAEALRAERDDCPEIERLMAHARGELAPEAAAAVARHLDLCPDCAALAALAVEDANEGAIVDDLAWRRAERRLDRRDAPWGPTPASLRPGRKLLGAAAVLAAATAATFWLGREPVFERPTPGATRGSALRPLAPVGPVDAVPDFRWQAPPAALRFEVEVERAGAPVWSGASSASPLAAPPELLARLEPGQMHRWRVRALAEDGRVVLASDWAEFELAAPGP